MNDKARRVFLNGEIDKESTEKVITHLLELDDIGPAPILLMVNSMGGNCPAMFMILNVIHAIAAPVNILILGRAYSAAAVLSILSAKGRRFMMSDATMMLHPVTTHSNGRVDEILQHAQYVSNAESIQIKRVLKSSTISQKQLSQLMRVEKIFSAQKALEWGFVDKIVTNLAADIPDYRPATNGQEALCDS
jgi:ATP-dependent Clp protease, protease subunit